MIPHSLDTNTMLVTHSKWIDLNESLSVSYLRDCSKHKSTQLMCIAISVVVFDQTKYKITIYTS